MTEVNDMARWSLPGGPEVPSDELVAQLEVYKETILLRGFEGSTTWVKTVSADAIAHAITEHIGFSSGLLPDGALWWGQGEAGKVVGLWRPSRVWPVALQLEAFAPPTRLRIPMPGLVFACSPGRAPWVYAALRRPTDPEERLFRAPAFNVFEDGRVCPGNHRFPDNITRTPESFFESYFSTTGNTHNRSKKHPQDLSELWKELDGQAEYPVDDLVAQCTVEEAIAASGKSRYG